MGYIYLSIAIISEVIATTALKYSEGFSRLVPSLVVVVGYCVSFYCLSIVLKSIPIGIAYAIWAGLGIVLIGVVGAVCFKQIPDWPAIIGMTLIIVGVVVINVFSNTASH